MRPLYSSWTKIIGIIVGIGIIGGSGAVLYQHRGRVAGVSTVVYVSPRGKDAPARGKSTVPYRTIHYALSQAQPGTTIMVAAGTYPEHLTSYRHGTMRSPITLLARGRVRLTGGRDQHRIFELKHNYYVIDGFEFSGKDILLWLQRANHTVVRNNFFHHSLGECIRVKYHSTHNLFEKNRVEDCGINDFRLGGGGKNGEGIYVGTAPEQLNKNPTGERDASSYNLIRHNTFITHGNECVDIKEGASYNVVEFNSCTGQKDPESAGFDSRGNNNIFRYNKSFNNKGAGIRLGGDGAKDGINNEIYKNELIGNAVALKVTRTPQRTICGNTASANRAGFSNKKEIVNRSCR